MICHTLRGPLLALLLSLPRENKGQDSCTELWALPASRTAGWTTEPGSNFSCSNSLMPHPKTRSPLKQDCLEQGLHRWDCGPGGTQLFRALRNKRLFPAVQKGINSEHLCSSAAAVPPCCQWQHFSAEGPRGPAAVLDHCVTSRRNVAGSELGQGLTRKEPFELTHPTPIKQQHDTHICPRLPACIVTGSERQTDG